MEQQKTSERRFSLRIQMPRTSQCSPVWWAPELTRRINHADNQAVRSFVLRGQFLERSVWGAPESKKVIMFWSMNREPLIWLR